MEENNSSGLNVWVRFLCVLFLASAASGIYIILSGGAKPECKDAPVESKGVSLASLAKAAKNEPGVAVIKIRGAITESQGGGWNAAPSASSIAKRIKTLGDNDNVKAILLDIDSPGGTVAAVQEIYNEILRVRTGKNKKVVAMFRDIGASGAYYIAMACDKVVAQPGSMVGSIGVIMQGSNFEGLSEKIGVKFFSIKSGAHKDMGSPWRAMTQEEKTLLQNMIDDSYDQFFTVVKENRSNVNQAELRVYADGRIFTGRQAFSVGLIDALGGESEAVKLAGELAGLKDPKIITIKADSVRDFFISLGDMQSQNVQAQINALSTPRVEYMWRM